MEEIISRKSLVQKIFKSYSFRIMNSNPKIEDVKNYYISPILLGKQKEKIEKEKELVYKFVLKQKKKKRKVIKLYIKKAESVNLK